MLVKPKMPFLKYAILNGKIQLSEISHHIFDIFGNTGILDAVLMCGLVGKLGCADVLNMQLLKDQVH